MNNYLILVIGWLIGQSGYAIIKAYKIQSENEAINFAQAIALVYKRTASIALAIVMLITAVFLMPDLFKSVLEKGDESNKWQMQIVNYLRISSIVYGVFCQWIGLLLFGKLNTQIKNIIDKDAKEN